MAIYRSKLNAPFLTAELRQHLSALIVESHKRHEYKHGNNFALQDACFKPWCDMLYEAFLAEAHKKLGHFNVRSDSNATCWAYVSNRYHYRGGIHHHLTTSTVNGVYYLSVPPSDVGSANTGALQFFDDERQPNLGIQPCEGDLLIFPNYLLHEPQRIDCDSYRIALNMEIICDYEWLR
jgi:Putative 2OG-Fe(II) oxygenase